jgi:DNA topoisomerase I
MATRRIGWYRIGSRRFRYVDSAGRTLDDQGELERIRALAIPPAWKDVWISRSPRAKLQATGVDAAGRKQYLYHPTYRQQRAQEKYDRLIRFAELLPQLRQAMSDDIGLAGLPEPRVAAIAVRLINLGWFRVGSERYAARHRTFGITTLRKSHVAVRGSHVTFRYRGKHGTAIRSAVVDAELAPSTAGA